MIRIDRSTTRIHSSRITLHELNIQTRCQNLYDVSIHYSCSLVFHAIQGVYEETSVSKQYRESNTHELYGKYGAYINPCR